MLACDAVAKTSSKAIEIAQGTGTQSIARMSGWFAARPHARSQHCLARMPRTVVMPCWIHSKVQPLAIELVVLPSQAANLDGANAIAEFDTALQRPTAFDPVQQRAAKCIAAAGRVEYLGRCHARNVTASALLPEIAALRAERDDHAAQM